MITTGLRWLAVGVALASAGQAPTAAAAEDLATCSATLSTVPMVISAPGTYCVDDYLVLPNWAGTAIRIEADDVVLDCNGFELDGHQAEDTTQAIGIQVIDRHDVTIRRCTVRHFQTGLQIGVSGSGTSERHLVEDNVFYGNRQTGMSVTGSDTVIRRNRVLETGLDAPNLPEVIGILAEGSIDVLDNTVSGVQGGIDTGNVWGITVRGNRAGSIRGNRVRGLRVQGLDSGVAIGVYDFYPDSRVTIRNNILAGSGNGYGWGLNCRSMNGFVQPDVHARNNTLVGFYTANEGCVDDGNVVRP